MEKLRMQYCAAFSKKNHSYTLNSVVALNLYFYLYNFLYMSRHQRVRWREEVKMRGEMKEWQFSVAVYTGRAESLIKHKTERCYRNMSVNSLLDLIHRHTLIYRMLSFTSILWHFHTFYTSWLKFIQSAGS